MSDWFLATNTPTKSGYYLTVHYSAYDRCHLRKAFWYDVTKSQWLFRYKPDVKIWYNRCFEFYVPCEMQDDVKDIPAEFLKLIENPK